MQITVEKCNISNSVRVWWYGAAQVQKVLGRTFRQGTMNVCVNQNTGWQDDSQSPESLAENDNDLKHTDKIKHRVSERKESGQVIAWLDHFRTLLREFKKKGRASLENTGILYAED